MKASSLRSFLRSPMAVVSLVLVALFVLTAILAPILWGSAAQHADPSAILAAPSAAHPLGTDNLGRDILLRTLVATRLSLGMALLATAAGAFLGLLIGALPSVLGGRTQRWFGAVINVWLAFPVLLVAMLTVILLGGGTMTAVAALVLTMTPSFARLAQTLSSAIGGSEYLAAARMLGVSRGRQFVKYILPNIAEPVIVNVTISIGGGLLALSSLSFLGVGVQPPAYDWGLMLSDGFEQVYSSPLAVVGPGVAVVLAGITFGMLGEALAAHMRGRGRAKVLSRRRLGPAPVTRSHLELPESSDTPLLEVRGLSVSFPGPSGWIRTIQDVSITIGGGEIVGVVGESGSGKSVTMMAIAGLTGPEAAVTAQSLRFAGEDLLGSEAKDLRRSLGTSIGVVFQDSLTALNPAMRVGTQLAEIPRVHSRMSSRRSKAAAVDALAEVRIPEPARRAGQFPHEFSGGMRQRALIAMAQIGKPRLIIADEPTTALDVTVQRRVLALLKRECDESGAAAIVVSHDIAVVAELCQRVLVMYGGRIVEDVDTRILATPDKLAHPYSRALAAALPDLGTDRSRPLATIPGDPPDLSSPITGCSFAARCPFASDECRRDRPPLAAHRHGGQVACWHPQDGSAQVAPALEGTMAR